jgi:hypothetical protein
MSKNKKEKLQPALSAELAEFLKDKTFEIINEVNTDARRFEGNRPAYIFGAIAAFTSRLNMEILNLYKDGFLGGESEE